jgi:hypothetical protein
MIALLVSLLVFPARAYSLAIDGAARMPYLMRVRIMLRESRPAAGPPRTDFVLIFRSYSLRRRMSTARIQIGPRDGLALRSGRLQK